MLKTDEENTEEEKNNRASYSDFTGKRKMVGLQKMVGLHDQLNQMKDMVLKDLSYVVSVVGMAGIGKTALVRQFYNDPLTIHHFHSRLFLPIGPRYQLKQTLLLAAHQLGVDSDQDASLQQLQHHVKESLSNRRKYLVVLDDIWHDSIFSQLFEIFSDYEACLIVTTQKLSLVSSDYSHRRLHIRFLDDDESWDLLHETVFSSTNLDQKQCNPQLKKIGRKIAKKCEGLPLAIIQVGQLLQNIETTVQNWKEVAEEEDPLIITTEENTPLSKALTLSYMMLPQHLKVCFMYMGVFPKKYIISRTKIVRLLVSEGFIKQSMSRDMEETAGEYLDELVSRSCVLSEKQRSMSKDVWETKTCKLHFTFRSLCVSEAKRENIFHVIRKWADCLPKNIDSKQQRLCINNNVILGFKQVHGCMESTPDVRSFLCFGPKQHYPIVLYLPFRLLEVLDVHSIRFYEFPYQVLDLSELIYLAITCDEELPPSISRLQNLRVFIFQPYHDIIKSPNGPVSNRYLPIEIWELRELKHLHCVGFDLPDPSSVDDSVLILPKLLTLSGVSGHSCTSGVLKRLPELIKIGVKIKSSAVETDLMMSSQLGDFASLKGRFESLKCVVVYPKLLTSQVVPFSSIPINFPVNVKKLSLSGCGFPWEYMRVIAALPNLKVLKLRCNAFCGPKWRSGEGRAFKSLEYLRLEDLDIQYWESSGWPFPKVKRVIIRHCYKLQQIPEEQLKWVSLIEVDYCSLSLVKQMQALNFGFTEARIKCAWDDDDNNNNNKKLI